MKKLFLVLLLTVNLAFGHGGDVSGGGGISESNIIYSFNNLSSTIQRALSVMANEFTSEELNFLEQLKLRSDLEVKTKQVFKTQKEYPFDGKTFSTKPQAGSQIFINLDLLFNLVDGKKVPFNYAKAFVFNLKVIERGMNILPDSTKATFYQKLERLIGLEEKTYALSAYGRDEIQLSLFNDSQLLLMDSNKLHNVTSKLITKLLCLSTPKVKTIKYLGNVHYSIGRLNLNHNSIKVLFHADIEYLCDDTLLAGKTSMEVTYKLKAQDNQTQINDSWWEKKSIEANIDLNKLQFSFRDLMQI